MLFADAVQTSMGTPLRMMLCAGLALCAGCVRPAAVDGQPEVGLDDVVRWFVVADGAEAVVVRNQTLRDRSSSSTARHEIRSEETVRHRLLRRHAIDAGTFAAVIEVGHDGVFRRLGSQWTQLAASPPVAGDVFSGVFERGEDGASMQWTSRSEAVPADDLCLTLILESVARPGLPRGTEATGASAVMPTRSEERWLVCRDRGLAEIESRDEFEDGSRVVSVRVESPGNLSY